MRIWIDLANSPHVELFEPIVRRLEERGDTVLLTVRDHAQTLQLARRRWPEAPCIGGASPHGAARKGAAIAGRAAALARYAHDVHVDVAVSHGSYAQLAAARLLGLPAVTMMDYEFQPANHLSFRLAQRVVVPDAFAEDTLRSCGADGKTKRYHGYKEEVYLAGRETNSDVLRVLGIDPATVLVVLRPPPQGALYHRDGNARFDTIARAAADTRNVTTVVLARGPERDRLVSLLPHAIVPETAVDGPSLLALADVTIGAGGTMTRESALLGTPTYTVFAGRLPGVDAALIEAGKLYDLRDETVEPTFVKKPPAPQPAVARERREEILSVLDRAVAEVALAPARPRRRHAVARRA